MNVSYPCRNRGAIESGRFDVRFRADLEGRPLFPCRYGDVSAHTAVEEGICILVQFCGAVMFGYVTASLAVVLSTQSETAQRIHAYRDKIEYVSKWSDAAKLPHKLRRKVKESFQQHFIFQDSIDVSQMTVEIYGELSPSLKNEVAGTLMLPVLQELFPNLIGSGALQKIASNCKPCPAKRGVKVFNFGDTSDRVYFLRRGAIEVLDELDDTICHMMAPKIIGMMSSYVCQLNSEEEEGLHDIFLTTAQTLLDSDIWFIEKKMLDRLFDFYPDLESEMIAAIRTYIKRSPGLWRFLPEHLSVAQFKRSKERKPRATG